MQADSDPVIKRIDIPGWKRYWDDQGFVAEMTERGMIRREPPEALNHVFHVGPYFACVVDYRDMSFQYIKGLENILGHDANILYTKKLEHLVEWVHPEDVQKVLGLAVHYFTFLGQQPLEKRLDFWPSINFRMRKANGDYLRVLEQVICLQVDEEGRITHALKYFTDISHLNYSGEVVLAVLDTKDNTGKQFYTWKANSAGANGTDNIVKTDLSEREKDILALVAKGLTSKEIAQKLQISHHTVNKHRENMLRKTGSKNLNEVLSFAYCNDYL